MTKLQNQLVTPQSLLIEKTALELAAIFYEAARSSGLKSQYKDARAFARAKVETFIPKAVDLLMDMLNSQHVPQDQKDMIYDAIMERSNDKSLSASGIDSFKVDAPFIPDWKPPSDIDQILSKAMKELAYAKKASGEIN